MKVNIVQSPPPLSFGEGENGFKLCLKVVNAAEKMAIIDAGSGASLENLLLAIERVVIGWENVLDINGYPIPFQEEDEKGRVKRNLLAFLGQIDTPEVVKVMAGIMTFLRIPAKDFDLIAGRLEVALGELDPTKKPGGSTTSTASGG